MIKNLDNYIIGCAIGIRYRANFSIEDKLGKIVDQILYRKNSFFNSNVFPHVYTNINEKVLIDKESQDHLVINNSNIVLEINFGEKFKINDLSKIVNKFNQEIIEGILKDFKVTEFNRVGFIRRYLFKMDKLADTFIDKTIGSTLEGINDINLRFSKKIPEMQAFIKKDLNDYYNAIFNIIKKADKQELFMSIDFQKYFDPFLSSAAELEFNDFFNKTTSFNNKTFLNWLNKNYGALK